MIEKIYAFFILLRPKQRIKNGIIFLPLFFSGSFDFQSFLYLFVLFLFFSLFVGSTYVFNDVIDRKKDMLHPVKSKRPIAKGIITPNEGIFFGLTLLVLTSAFLYSKFGFIVGVIALTYLSITLGYSYRGKNQVILDVLFIAMGFVIRGYLGGIAMNISLSPRFISVLFFGALFLGFMKRYQEVKLGTTTRKVIVLYNEKFLEQIISMLSAILIVSYTLYSFSGSSGFQGIIFTVPCVVFIVFRCYYNVFFLNKYKEGLEDIIFSDAHLIICGLIMIMIIAYFLYFSSLF